MKKRAEDQTEGARRRRGLRIRRLFAGLLGTRRRVRRRRRGRRVERLVADALAAGRSFRHGGRWWFEHVRMGSRSRHSPRLNACILEALVSMGGNFEFDSRSGIGAGLCGHEISLELSPPAAANLSCDFGDHSRPTSVPQRYRGQVSLRGKKCGFP
jgi:hypothetical protein